MCKKVCKILVGILAVILIGVVCLVAFLSVTEYKPEPRQLADRIVSDVSDELANGNLTIYTWNIGYAGLGKESDFFMDGGKMVDPPSQETVVENLAAIKDFVQNASANAWLFQEVDVNSARTESLDQFAALQESYSGNAAFAYNYKCPFVPIPLPPMGRIEGGLATIATLAMQEDSERISLPCPFSWPVRAANIKRCLLVTRMNVMGSDKEVVLVNLHLEAYESGEGRIAQTKQLLELMQTEYEKGNYVIAGGDFNQTFPGALDVYPIMNQEKWMPGILEKTILPDGWQFACDTTTATCRLLDQPYSEACQLYVIDGFILSPNVELQRVETVSLDFENSDHNPVRLEVSLMPEA